jgi:cellulose synthase/poly-beta-1,6-N-acetylglucosamine synthase-like glycosyltransferase
MITAIKLLLLVLAVTALVPCVCLLGATLLSGRRQPPSCPSRRLRFDVIVPAHNEAAVIARTVASLRKLDWPADLFRILVVADNCSDTTASIARSAGAEVLERVNLEFRGKGYALAHAFAISRQQGRADAVVVIDADSVATANLLEAFAARLERGAHAVQAHYGVLNPHDSWRTRLMTIATASVHTVRSRARGRLGVSCGIHGNGWCVTHQLLERVPYRAFSLTEDLEYGIALGLAGFRVEYADEAHSDADMVSGEQIAGKQHQRWEDGRFQLIRTKTLPLFKAAILRRDAVCFDLAIDLIVLPLSYVVLNVAAVILLAVLACWWEPSLSAWIWVGLGYALCLVVYVMRGWQLSGMGAQGLLDLVRAPGYVIWKILLMLRRRSSGWVRTDRENQ